MSKRLLSIAVLVVVTALTTSELVAQQSSSATQVVTFGVSRTSQMVVSSVSSLASGQQALNPSARETVEHTLAALPAKVTFSTKSERSAIVQPGSLFTAEKTRSIRELNSAYWLSRNDGHIQTDVRTLLEHNELAPLSTSSLVLTITD